MLIEEVNKMFRKIQSFILANMALFLVFIAGTGIGTNCWWTSYEPDIPECLKK
jgi:cyclic lactone autoinducer peptide